MNCDTTTGTTAPRNPRLCRVWDIQGARTQALESKGNVALTRDDGSQSGLMVTPDGQLRRTTLKPQGKAARKEFKRLRRQLRGLDPAVAPVAVKILKRRALDLCLPGRTP